MRYVIEPIIAKGETLVGTSWVVIVDGKTVFEGTALDCIAFCEAQGAERKGPRLYISI